MFVVPLRSAEEVPYSPDVKMIAFTKPEKDDIMRHGRTADGKTNQLRLLMRLRWDLSQSRVVQIEAI